MTDPWRSVSRPPPLLPGELHVWQVAVDAANLEACRNLLMPDEHGQAAAFRQPADRARFVATRGTLRRLLGHYLDRNPASLHFAKHPAGKPFIAFAAQAPKVRFNVAHSGNVALLAFALGVEVGVDVELCRPDVDVLDLSARFFAESEAAELRGAPPERRLDLFYHCWTRKEACLKAVAEGLQVPLDSFVVGCRGDACRVSVAGATDATTRLVHVESLPLAEDYRAAVAVVGENALRIVRLTPLYIGDDSRARG